MSGFKPSPRLLLPALLAGCFAIGGVTLAWTLRARPAPSLARLDALLAAEQFDEAERQLGVYLNDQPDSTQGNILMAQVALGRPDQKPRLALDHLRRVQARDRSTLAIVRLNEGKAYSALEHYDRAEHSWLAALKLDPLVPEACWALLGLYYVEGRRADARRLALAAHTQEPDPRDRVQLLLELVRQDAKPIVAFTIMKAVDPVVRKHPDDVNASIALAKASIRDDKPDAALPILNRLVARYPENPVAWEALLAGLDDAVRPDEFALTMGRLPKDLGGEPRFAKFRGIEAQNRRDWPAAVDAFIQARQFDPTDAQLVYRLSRAFRMTSRAADAEPLEADFKAMQDAAVEILPLYNEANAVGSLGTAPHPELYHRIASLREKMGLRAEALSWHRLVLQDDPSDSISLAAVNRLADANLPSLEEVLATPASRSRP